MPTANGGVPGAHAGQGQARSGRHLAPASPRAGRLPYFDNAKALLMLLVVIGHLIGAYATFEEHAFAKATFTFIYTFHMPMFIFVSGLFVDVRRLTGAKCAQRVTFFAILGFVGKVMTILNAQAFGLPFKFFVFYDASLPWFMFVIAEYYLLAYLLRDVNLVPVFFAAIMVGTFAGLDASVNDNLYLSRAIVYLPYFLAGVMLVPANVERALDHWYVRVAGLVGLLVLYVVFLSHSDFWYHLQGMFSGHNPFERIYDGRYSWPDRLFAYGVSLATSVSFLCAVPHREVPLLTSSGAGTLPVYLLHGEMLQACGYAGIRNAWFETPLGWKIVVPLGILITVALSRPCFVRPFDALAASLRPKERE